MKGYFWGVLWPLGFSIACFIFSVDYAFEHRQANLPAFLTYATVGGLGLFVSIAFVALHGRIAALERRLGERP
jgi:hypothetical protein